MGLTWMFVFASLTIFVFGNLLWGRIGAWGDLSRVYIVKRQKVPLNHVKCFLVIRELEGRQSVRKFGRRYFWLGERSMYIQHSTPLQFLIPTLKIPLSEIQLNKDEGLFCREKKFSQIVRMKKLRSLELDMGGEVLELIGQELGKKRPS